MVMDKEKLIGNLRNIIDKEQELYDLYISLAEETEDEDIKEFLGLLAHEEYSHICSTTEQYQKCVDQKTGSNPPGDVQPLI
jgi:rubrerythrin